MPSDQPFRFQRFAVQHDRVAMKVGTDAVLLGAWAPIRGANRILEIGTGSGIVALMLAQRSEQAGSVISAIDIDRDAAEQSADNFLGSPWPERLPNSPEQIHYSIRQYSELKLSDRFDLIVTNPPYFLDSFQPGIPARSVARHARDGFQQDLFDFCRNHLNGSGRLCLIIPREQVNSLVNSAAEVDLNLHSQVMVKGNETSDVKRVLLEFGFESLTMPASIETLTIEQQRHQHTEQFAQLTQQFFLRYQ